MSQVNGNTNPNVDPISKCKELMPQFKQNLVSLMQQLNSILNPDSNNANMENQFQMLGKYVEIFNRLCDSLIVNLRVSCEIHQLQSLSNNFERIAYQHQNQDSKVQLARIMEIRNVLQRFINSARPLND